MKKTTTNRAAPSIADSAPTLSSEAKARRPARRQWWLEDDLDAHVASSQDTDESRLLEQFERSTGISLDDLLGA